jgi:hypothetical protein
VPRALFRLLCQISDSESLPRSLALIVLLIGREVWAKFQSRRRLFVRATRLLLAGRCLPVFQQVYSLACAAEQDAFLASVREIVAEGPAPEEGRALCGLISAMAFDNPSVFGARGSLELARIAAGCPALAEFAERELTGHVAAFPNVASDGDALAIATVDRWLHAFRKRRPTLEVKICSGAIDCVSIGPGKWAIPVSPQEGIAKVVCLARGGILRPRERVIEFDVEEWNEVCKIIWAGPEAADVSIRKAQT